MSAHEQAGVAVVIPSWNTWDLTRKCLETLRACRPVAEQVIVVDNGSEDGSADLIAEHFPEVELIRNPDNRGFAIACNQGLVRVKAEYAFLLNTDTEVASDVLGQLAGYLDEHPQHGAVAPKLIHADGSTQRTCMAFPKRRTALWFGTPLERRWPESSELRRYFVRDWDHEDSRDVDQPPAAAFLVRRSILEELGTFDESLWLYFNDVDLSRRLDRAGWKTHYLAHAQVVHHVGVSTRRFGSVAGQWHKNRLTYYRKQFGFSGALAAKLGSGLALLDLWSSERKRRKAGEPPMDLSPYVELFKELLRS